MPANPTPPEAMALESWNDHQPWTDCWQCGGEGEVASCFEEFACIDPEEGCDDCRRRCDICKGKGGWHGDE